MKKLLFLFLIIPSVCFSQKNKSAEVMGHVFNVGDTITFTSGTMPNGDFACATVSPALFVMTDDTPPNLGGGYAGMKFIIEKIKTAKIGMNVAVTLVIKVLSQPVWIDTSMAIAKKEIKI